VSPDAVPGHGANGAVPVVNVSTADASRKNAAP
jgi:hypothetical protein